MLRIVMFLVVVIMAAWAQGMPGGWRTVDVNAPEMTDISLFAINAKYPGAHPRFRVVEAKKQVVAGLKYDFTLELTSNETKECKVEHFQVWDRFGERSVVLQEVLADKCAPPVN